jgi:hypothetical protein
MSTGPRCGSETTRQDYKFDAWNRLAQVKEGATVVANFGYDGPHRRIGKATSNQQQATDFYFNEGWQVVEERSTINSQLSTASQHVSDPRYIDAPVVLATAGRAPFRSIVL